MKVGDLVRSVTKPPARRIRAGIIVEMIQKKCWRTDVSGTKVDWAKIDPEPHAVVLFPDSSGTISIPVVDLEVLDESR
jgi:hypothetical protein